MTKIDQINTIFNEMGGTRSNSRDLIDEIKSIQSVSLIGRGANRAVFKSGNNVYKIPINSTGHRQNKLAFEKQSLNGHSPPLIARIIGLEENVLVQEYCSVVSGEKDKVKQKLDKHGLVYTDWDDDSVGLKNGELVLVDVAGLQFN